MINKLQSLKGETKLKFNQNFSDCYDEMNIRRQSGTFHFEEDPFSRNVEGIGRIYQEVLLLMNFLRTTPSVKGMNNNYYDLCYTVGKNRNVKEIVNDECEVDYINLDVFISPNHYIRRKSNDVTLR